METIRNAYTWKRRKQTTRNVEVLKAGHEALVVDSLVNGNATALARVGQLTNTQVPLEVGDIRDRAFLERVF